MTTLAEYRSDLDARISAAKISGFWTDAAKNLWINQAGQRVCDFKPWKFLELALTTQTRDLNEYYDYPTGPNGFKRDSIYQLGIEGEEYPDKQRGRAKKTWNEFELARQADSEQKIFASHNGFYFIHPIPADGLEMSIYGLRIWQKLEDDDDESIAPETFDEAVVRIALATCLRKAKKHVEARGELEEILHPVTGVLAIMWGQEGTEAPKGYIGEAVSSRWG